jgi:hypothetical protein
MADEGTLQDIKQRIQPILAKVAVEGLHAWLKTIGFSVPRSTRAAITEVVAKHIADGKLSEDALKATLIGFEEASNMRIYLFRFDDEADASAAKNSLPERLERFGIPVREERQFAGDKKRPMSPVYALLEGDALRVKWAEEQIDVKLDPQTMEVKQHPVPKRAVLIADYRTKIAELRLNPPEGRHTHVDGGGRISADAYYGNYIQKSADLLGCGLKTAELRPVIKGLVEQNEPRLVRIQIDDHTNQTNYKNKTTGPRADVRDSPDWQLAYKEFGHTWAWDKQSFYWLPRASSGFLKREVYTHINAEDSFLNVNADCSDGEVEYVVSQIRAR